MISELLDNGVLGGACFIGYLVGLMCGYYLWSTHINNLPCICKNSGEYWVHCRAYYHTCFCKSWLLSNEQICRAIKHKKKRRDERRMYDYGY